MARIKAHFDGRVFVPDEPVDLRAGDRVEVDVTPANGPRTNGAGANGASRAEIEKRLAALRRVFGSVSGPVLPDEALTREQIYRDDV